MKKEQPITKNVYELAQERLDIIFKEFDNIYVSFSGGKDSGILLNMCIDYIRKHKLNRKIGVYHMDYEVQYKMTIDYVDRIFEANKDILEIYRICVPFRVATSTSMYQSYWRPWEEDKKDMWVRELPKYAMTADNFPGFKQDMWDYDFQIYFADWLHRKKKASRTCCLVGIRTQESFNRWRCIYQTPKYFYITVISGHAKSIMTFIMHTRYTIGVRPMYGLPTANSNGIIIIYTTFITKAGVSIERMRVASPFISEAIESLALYKAIDPNTWGRMIGRVNGVNFAAIYGSSHATARHRIKLPKGYTWKSFMFFLLSTLPEETRNGYLRRLDVSIKFWRTKGGCLSNEVIQKLIDAKIPIEIVDKSNYKTTKHPVRMDYLEDIDIAEFKEIPTYKRMCICILRNDHACKYMGFSPTKEEISKKNKIMENYKHIWR